MDALEITDSEISLAIVSDKAIAVLHENGWGFLVQRMFFLLIFQARKMHYLPATEKSIKFMARLLPVLRLLHEKLMSTPGMQNTNCFTT